MTKILSGKQNTQFPVPGGITQRDVCTGTGGLATKAGSNTYKEFFMTGALPTNNCNVEPTKIDVCQLSTGTVVSINEDDYNDTAYSKNTDNCKPPTLQACDLKTGSVVTIDRDKYNTTDYSMDTTNCKSNSNSNSNNGNDNGNSSGTIQACDTSIGKVVTIQSSQLDNKRYTTNTTSCSVAPTSP
jgi:hypothetical protein